MSNTFTGFIRNTKTNSGTAKRPPYKQWTSYNAEIHGDFGVQKISFGFDKPEVREGDYVTLTADLTNGFMQVDQSTVERLQPPAETEKKTETSATTAAAGSGGTSNFGEFNRQTNPEDARRMSYANARTAAIEMVRMLMETSAMPVSMATSKAGAAKRFDELNAAVDKLTVRFFNDGISLRLLDTVADTVQDTAAQGDLPSDSKDSEATGPSVDD